MGFQKSTALFQPFRNDGCGCLNLPQEGGVGAVCTGSLVLISPGIPCALLETIQGQYKTVLERKGLTIFAKPIFFMIKEKRESAWAEASKGGRV